MFFEREGLSSFDSSAEMIFNILSAVAQEESRSISENIKWAKHKKMERGEHKLGNNRLLGYDANKEGVLVPNGDAWIVKRIFEDYAAGLGLAEITKKINLSGATRLRSKNPFDEALIYNMLANEIFVGDRLFQKNAPVDYISKKPDKTVDFVSYYRTDDHEGIISRELWNAVKARREQEKNARENCIYKNDNCHFLYGIVFCGECGAVYTRRTVRGPGGIQQKIWKCHERLYGDCKGAIITEENLLRRISDYLGWNWFGVESFDSEQFLMTVARIEIYANGIWIDRKKAV